MHHEYKDGFKNITGQKFIKVVNKKSVKDFVVNEDGDRFQMVYLLNNTSWRATAKNMSLREI